MNTFYGLLTENNCSMFYKITKFEGSHLFKFFKKELLNQENGYLQINTDGAEWKVGCESRILNEETVDLKVTFTLCKGSCSQTNIGIDLQFKDWHRDNYVLMPSAVYNGNRFEARCIPYPPILTDPADMSADIPTIITDVPRLNIEDGPSSIQLLAGDLSTPAIGFHSLHKHKGFWLLTNQNTVLGDSGLEIEESPDRNEAVISLTAPGVRYDKRYIICNTGVPCEDRGVDFIEGDSVQMVFRLYFFHCPKIQTLFDYFVNIRKDLSGPTRLPSNLPFSSAWNIQEKKYNEQNWEEKSGYYSVGMRENIHQDWQIGWVGGIIATYPLLFEGSQLSKERALRNFNFIFNEGQDKSGFFYSCGHQGKWFGDNFHDLAKKWHLIRKSSDALYFIIKQFMLIEKKEMETRLPLKWIEGTRRCANAFVKLWDDYGQFGQFVDNETGKILIGGSASAGIAPAGLALLWQYFGDDSYLRVAKQSARHFYDNFVRKGYTTGGPGEICQCPDSESAFGLLESFTVLFEVTGEHCWLTMAKELANQCFTWCVSYDFTFPPNSTFGRLGIHTAGSVYANVQNKHSAPGICTLSGVSLFKLYRATGDVRYLELVKETAHNMTQYLSRDNRRITGLVGFWTDWKAGEWYSREMPAGWMNERIQMSDWLEPVGEVFYGSCWCEVSNMLTFVEIPGLYIQPDTCFLCAIDHIEAKVVDKNDNCLVINVHNPSDFSASVKVFVENSTEKHKTLGQNALLGCKRIEIDTKESIVIRIPLFL